MDRHKSFLIVALVIAALLSGSCTRRSGLDTGEIREWAKAEGYVWSDGPDEIRTQEAFFDYIDGAAQPIIDLGWKHSLFGVLEKGDSRLRLTVHKMVSPKEAAALFDQNVFDDTRPIDVGERAVSWDRGVFSKGILFQKGSFVCELVFEKEGGQAELLDLASSLETRMK